MRKETDIKCIFSLLSKKYKLSEQQNISVYQMHEDDTLFKTIHHLSPQQQ